MPVIKEAIQIGSDEIGDLRNIKPIKTEVIWVPQGASLLPYLQEKVWGIMGTTQFQAFGVRGGSFNQKGSNHFAVNFYNDIPQEILKKWEVNKGGK